MKKIHTFVAILCLSPLMQPISTAYAQTPPDLGGSVKAPADISHSTKSIVEKKVRNQMKSTPGGIRESWDTVSYEGGNVKITVSSGGTEGGMSNSLTTAGRTTYKHGCPAGFRDRWFCFYEGYQWNEREVGLRRLQFKDCNAQKFATYNFENKVSSWVNTSLHVITVWNRTSRFREHLWLMNPGGESSFVGYRKDDRADHFTCPA